jgi:hypothetical protein
MVDAFLRPRSNRVDASLIPERVQNWLGKPVIEWQLLVQVSPDDFPGGLVLDNGEEEAF